MIGPNGAGKTTLFRMITGQDKPDDGTIKIGEFVHLGYVDQCRDSLDGNKTVWEEISGGLDQLMLGKREVNSRGYCSSFNFKGADQQKKVGALSGGERNRVHLAKMLKSGANLLLLDEPTNDLDVDTLRALEEALEDFAGCAVIISHDRWFLDRIATHMLAFEGESHVEWFEGNFQDYEEDKKRRLGVDFNHPAPDQVQEVHALTGRPERLGVLRQRVDLGLGREASERLLGEFQRAVDENFEHAAARADELDVGIAQLLQSRPRTEGLGLVASTAAVVNGDLHRRAPRMTKDSGFLGHPPADEV